MRYTSLGKSGMEVSVIGLGAWAIGGWMWGGTDEKESIKAINTALDNGINLIDTAPAYNKGYSEEIVGRAIKGKRDKFVIATKCGLQWRTPEGEFFFEYDSGERVYKYNDPDSIKIEVEESLKRMDIEHIDLYQTHWQEDITPIEDTIEALMELKEQGKIRAIGACNASVSQLEEYASAGILDVDQEKYNLIDADREKDNIPWCANNNVTFLAYSPIAQGLLTDKIDKNRKFEGDDQRISDPRFSLENRKKINAILESGFQEVADKYRLTITQLSIAAVTSLDNTVALCGIRNESQAKENAGAGDSVIEDKDMEYLRDSLESFRKEIR